MSLMVIRLVFLSAFLQTILCLKCLDTPINPNFSSEQFAGKWYEIERIAQPYQNILVCGTANYFLRSISNPFLINYNHKARTTNGLTEKQNDGTLEAVNKNEPNKFILKSSFRIGGGGSERQFTENYHVWDTDYTNYAVIYSCKVTLSVIQSVKNEYVIILSRKKTLDQNIIDRIKQNFGEQGLDTSLIVPVRTNCPNTF